MREKRAAYEGGVIAESGGGEEGRRGRGGRGGEEGKRSKGWKSTARGARRQDRTTGGSHLCGRSRHAVVHQDLHGAWAPCESLAHGPLLHLSHVIVAAHELPCPLSPVVDAYKQRFCPLRHRQPDDDGRPEFEGVRRAKLGDLLDGGTPNIRGTDCGLRGSCDLHTKTNRTSAIG